VTIDAARVDDLREAFEAHAADVLTADDLQPVERVDAVVGGAQLGLALADELAQLEPTGMGNPGVNVLVSSAALIDARQMGEEGKHVRFTVEAGGGRCRAVAFGCDGRLPVGPDVLADATFRLERNNWNGAVEPRLRLRHAAPVTPEPIAVIGEPTPNAWLATVLAHPTAPRSPDVAERRTIIDRRGEGALMVLRDLTASGDAVLAIVADVPRRIGGLAERAGGFSLCSHGALTRSPDLTDGFNHLVVLDPPAHPDEDARLRAGVGRAGVASITHLCWGSAELRFVKQIHESEHGLRAALVPLYRALRDRGGAAGEELEALLRGDGPHARSVEQAARLVAILTELDLVSLDRDAQALTVQHAERTTLERSTTYRATMQRYEDGLRWLMATETATGQLQTLA
jgi:single-stranded-DNA-specific exonuclease